LVARDGLTLRWEDDSKSLQASVFIKADVSCCARSLFAFCRRRRRRRRHTLNHQTTCVAPESPSPLATTKLFVGFTCPPTRVEFGVNFSQLVDTLSVFMAAKADGDGALLALRYPGPDGELQLEMRDAGAGGGNGGGVRMATYARLVTLERADGAADLADYWQEPAAYLLAPAGALLKEAVEDLEWPGGAVELELVRDPPAVSLRAEGNGTLEVRACVWACVWVVGRGWVFFVCV
jgi:hypothetical protein